jgi:hypothetical protein
MKIQIRNLTILALAAIALPLVSKAQTIGNTTTEGTTQIYAAHPSQSFTALDGGLSSFEFNIQAFNTQDANVPLTLTIEEGNGPGGSVVDSETFSLPDDFSGFAGITYSTPLDLTAGDMYTAVLTTSNPYWGLGLANPASTTYNAPDGYAFFGSSDQYQPYYHNYTETEFQATFGATSSAPDASGTAVLLGAALLALAGIRRHLAAESYLI